MRYRTLKPRVNPAKIGIDTNDEELDKINQSMEENGGKVDLADVYDIPVNDSVDQYSKTVTKYLEKDGIEYTEKQYQKEYQLKAAHKIMINGGSMTQIAQALNISLNEARNLKRELTSRQIRAVKNMNVEQEVAKALMFYDHVAAKALQLSNKQGGPKDSAGTIMRNQIEALKVALQTQTDKQKFLGLVGAYEVGLRSGIGKDTMADDASSIRDMLSGILSGDVYEIIPDEEEVDDGIEIL